MRSPHRSIDRNDSGSAPVEVTLVLAAVMTILLGILQIGITGIAHTLAVGAASDAARGVAISREPEVASARIDRIDQLPFLTIEKVEIADRWIDGTWQAEVVIRASVPALLPWSEPEFEVTRHALIESDE